MPTVTQLVGTWDWHLGGPAPEHLLSIALFYCFPAISKLGGVGETEQSVLCQDHCERPLSSESSPGLHLGLPALLLCTCIHWIIPLLPTPHARSCLGCFFCLMLPALLCCPCQIQSSTFQAWSLPETPFSGMHRKSCPRSAFL